MELKDYIKSELESGNVIKLEGQLDYEYTLAERLSNFVYSVTSRIRSILYVAKEQGLKKSIAKNFRHIKFVRKLLG